MARKQKLDVAHLVERLLAAANKAGSQLTKVQVLNGRANAQFVNKVMVKNGEIYLQTIDGEDDE
jgi:hypothetical protein